MTTARFRPLTGPTRILGTRVPVASAGGPVRAYERGRTCGHGACDTILSIYNPSRYCWAHEKLASGAQTRDVPRATREVVCENCSTLFDTASAARRFCSDGCRVAAFTRRKGEALGAERRQQPAPAHGRPAGESGSSESVA